MCHPRFTSTVHRSRTVFHHGYWQGQGKNKQMNDKTMLSLPLHPLLCMSVQAGISDPHMGQSAYMRIVSRKLVIGTVPSSLCTACDVSSFNSLRILWGSEVHTSLVGRELGNPSSHDERSRVYNRTRDRSGYLGQARSIGIPSLSLPQRYALPRLSLPSLRVVMRASHTYVYCMHACHLSSGRSIITYLRKICRRYFGYTSALPPYQVPRYLT